MREMLITDYDLVLLGIYENTFNLFEDMKEEMSKKLEPYQLDESDISAIEESVSAYYGRNSGYYDGALRLRINQAIEEKIGAVSGLKTEINQIVKNTLHQWIDQYKSIVFPEYSEIETLRMVSVYVSNLYWTNRDEDEAAAFFWFCRLLEESLSRTMQFVYQLSPYVLKRRLQNAINQKMCGKVVVNTSEEAEYENDIRAGVLIPYKNLKLISCNQNHHDVREAICRRKLYKADASIRIPVHQCITCGKLFVGETTIIIFERYYGHIIAKYEGEEGNYTENEYFYYDLGESKLHSLGYNVVEGRMTEGQRHQMLIDLYTDGEITFFEICRDLEYAIRLFGKNRKMVNAVKKWKRDLEFFNNWIANHNTKK